MSGICGRRRLAALAFVSGAFGYLRGFRRFRKKPKDVDNSSDISLADVFALYAASSQVVPSEIDDTSVPGDRFFSGFLQWASIVEKEVDVCDCKGETCGCNHTERTGLAVTVGQGVGVGIGSTDGIILVAIGVVVGIVLMSIPLWKDVHMPVVWQILGVCCFIYGFVLLDLLNLNSDPKLASYLKKIFDPDETNNNDAHGSVGSDEKKP